MRVALVHDWLNGMRGGEKVLEVLCELYPEAEIFTLILDRAKVSARIGEMEIHTSFLQHFPQIFRRYRSYLPLFPLAVERFDLKGYDLVISTSHAVAKGARTPDSCPHICYCFTPMRYIWYFYGEYFGQSPLKKILLGPIFTYLRWWDVVSSRRVDRFYAISKNVARRVAQLYNKHAEIIYPPVNTDFFVPAEGVEDFFLMVSALVPYKRVDLAITAFNRLGLPLKIIGTGPLAGRLKKAAGKNIRFLGWQDNESLRSHYQRCRALIFPGVEDFGIVPVEAMACGRPIIGLGQGGLLESTVPLRKGRKSDPTAVLFYEQRPEAMIEAVNLFLDRESEFDKEVIREHSLKFDRRIFKRNIQDAVKKSVEEYSKRI